MFSYIACLSGPRGQWIQTLWCQQWHHEI